MQNRDRAKGPKKQLLSLKMRYTKSPKRKTPIRFTLFSFGRLWTFDAIFYIRCMESAWTVRNRHAIAPSARDSSPSGRRTARPFPTGSTPRFPPSARRARGCSSSASRRACAAPTAPGGRSPATTPASCSTRRCTHTATRRRRCRARRTIRSRSSIAGSPTQ